MKSFIIKGTETIHHFGSNILSQLEFEKHGCQNLVVHGNVKIDVHVTMTFRCSQIIVRKKRSV